MSAGVNGAEVIPESRIHRWERKTNPEDLIARDQELGLIRNAVQNAVRHEMKNRDSVVTWLAIGTITAVVVFAVMFAFAIWGPGGGR